MNTYEELKEYNLTSPEAPAKDSFYTPCMEFGENLAYISGYGPATGDKKPCDKLEERYTTEEGMEWTKNFVLGVLAVLETRVGDSDKVGKTVKILVFVTSDDKFVEQPMVASGASALLGKLFGTENLPSRFVAGVSVLPGDIPVGVKAIFELGK